MLPAPRGSATSPLVYGRDAESSRLDAALEAMTRGEPRPVVIGGEAGIGKTRLIDEALERAGPDLRVLHGACLALGSTIPYLPFAEIVRDLVRQVSSATLNQVVGPARAELARFLPEVTAVVRADGQASPAPERSDELERLRLYEAFLRVAERIAADTPTVFVIEDVQWIDRASLELLAFLAHGLQQSHRAALIVSVRPEEVEDKEPVLTLLADLGRGSRAERIELGPLDETATRRLAAAVLGTQPPSELMARVTQLSDGNPLFAEELLGAWRSGQAGDTLPPKLRDLLAARLAHVPDDVLEVLRVAAASGRSVDDRLLTTVADLDEEQVQRAVHLAVDDHILIRTEGPARPGYRFRHEILRALVASQLLPAQSRRIHAAYAEALSQEPSERRSATEIADHWDAAGDSLKALGAHIEAGRTAVSRFAFSQASDHFERALVLLDETGRQAQADMSRSELLGDAASAAARAGEFDRAIELTRQLISARDELEPETWELARSSLRWYLWESGDLEAALDETQAVLADPAPMPARWRANALGHMAGLLLFLQRTEEAGVRAREALEVAQAAGASEAQALAEGVLGWCLLLEGDVEGGLEVIRRVLVAARLADEGVLEGRYPVGAALAHSQLAVALELVGRLEEAHHVAEAGVLIAREQGVGRTFGASLEASSARALFQLGRWSEADEAIASALRYGAVGSGRIALLAVRALLANGRGRADDAAATLAEAESLVNDTTPLDVRRWLTAAGVEHSIWQGDPVAALARMAFLAEDPDRRSVAVAGGQPAMLDASVPHLLALGARACADAAMVERASSSEAGLSAMAEAQLQDALRRARKRRALAEVWAADLAIARAELERAAGSDPATRVRQWKAAAGHVSARPYASCYVRWRLAEAHLSRRDGRDDAAPLIESALSDARALGAQVIADELIALARRARLALGTGDGQPGVGASDAERPYGLTAREAEVLALLAGGLSNQEIAERLFISPKTASVHVSNIYGKLAVESRVAAATLAHEMGLDEVLPEDGA